MKRLLLLILLFISFYSFSQINERGIPLITNYYAQNYKASDQNWSVAQDNRGVIYFANTDGVVIEYDGVNYRKIPNDNGSFIRNLYFDEKNEIMYVSAVGEIGYLEPNLEGKYVYQNLTNKIDSGISFGNVWQILNYNDTIVFSSREYLLFFKDLEFVKGIKHFDNTLFSFLANDRIYTGNYVKGLLFLDKNDELNEVPGGSFFAAKDISFIVPYRNQLLIGTQQHGTFLYDPETGYVKEKVINSNLNNYFKNEVTLYAASDIGNSEYLLSAIYGGAVVIDEKGHPLYHLKKKNGLSDDINFNSFQSKYLDNTNSNLWLTFNSNISKVEYHSPIRKLDESFGFSGTINDIIYYKDHLYVATFNGTYVRKFDENNYTYFEKIEGIDNTWSFEIMNIDGKEKLLCGTDRGVYVYEGNNQKYLLESKIINLEESTKVFVAYKLFSPDFNTDLLFIGEQVKFDILEHSKGTWKIIKTYRDDEIKLFEEDKEGNVWYTPFYSGVGKISLNDGELTVTKYDTANGLPTISGNRVFKLDNEILFGTAKGIYEFDGNKFVPYSRNVLKEYYKMGATVDKFSTDIFGNIWFSYNKNDEHHINQFIRNNDTLEKVDIPFNRLPSQTVEVIYNDPFGITWIGITDQLFTYDQKYQKNYNQKYYTLIRKAIIGEDSFIFNGTFSKYNEKGQRVVSPKQTADFKYELSYANNGITFQYAAPYYEEESKIEYSYYLRGFKDPWSKWSDRTERVYTNLDEGNYTFMVKARNIYGVESEVATFDFSISPPWYRTIVAYIAYFILAIFTIVIIVKVYTRRLELEKIRLEGIVAERTAEVVKQKEEIEAQKEEIMDSIHYARRIQRAVVPSPEKAEEVLPEHFLLWLPRDIVSGDFWWMTERDNKIIVVAADCTGHGVPGAFMSMLGVSFLNEIVNKEAITTANVILNELRESVKATLKQTGKEGEAKDGMDLALVIIDKNTKKLQYAGAYNPLFIYRNTELIEIKADRNPIGIYVKEKESFTNHEFDYEPGDTFYIFSDGYVDQFGGEKGEKFKTKNFKVLLAEIQNEPMQKQREILYEKIHEWRGETEQIDDIIVLGIRLS